MEERIQRKIREYNKELDKAVEYATQARNKYSSSRAVQDANDALVEYWEREASWNRRMIIELESLLDKSVG